MLCSGPVKVLSTSRIYRDGGKGRKERGRERINIHHKLRKKERKKNPTNTVPRESQYIYIHCTSPLLFPGWTRVGRSGHTGREGEAEARGRPPPFNASPSKAGLRVLYVQRSPRGNGLGGLCPHGFGGWGGPGGASLGQQRRFEGAVPRAVPRGQHLAGEVMQRVVSLCKTRGCHRRAVSEPLPSPPEPCSVPFNFCWMA